MITRKALSRRTFLRGMGTAVALPFLDAMVPALRARRRQASRPSAWRSSTCRTASRCTTGIRSTKASSSELPRILKPLEPFKDDILLLGNLTHNTGRALLDGAGDHGRCCGSYLTGIQVKKSTTDIKASVSCDQLVANQVGKQTRFPSLEIGLEDARQAGDCDSGYSCAYTNNLAWRSETQPLPPILDPRALFERLFGDGVALSPEARARQAKYRRSILDFVTRRHQEAEDGSRSHRQAQARRVSLLDPRSRAADREGGEGQRADRSAHGEALRHAGRFRRALQADDRHDDDRVSGRPDARPDVPGHARRHLARLSRDRHLRRPPSADASSQSGRPDGEGGADQRLSHRSSSPAGSRS